MARLYGLLSQACGSLAVALLAVALAVAASRNAFADTGQLCPCPFCDPEDPNYQQCQQQYQQCMQQCQDQRRCLVCDDPCTNFVAVGESCTLNGVPNGGGLACPDTCKCQDTDDCKM